MRLPSIIGMCAFQSSAFQLMLRHGALRSFNYTPRPSVKIKHRNLYMSEDEFYFPPTLERIQNHIIRSKSTSYQSPDNLLIDGLAASHLGLEPLQNTRHAPMVYHENYSFDDWPPTHTFPMDKFRMTAHSLLEDADENEEPLVRSVNDFYKPLSFKDFPTSILSPPIDKSFLRSFLNGQLTKEECRFIGFREQTYRPELIERTILEVAGTILTAQLALKYGLACHVAGGTHHAESARGKGYTIINDLACAARLMTWTEDDATGEDASTLDFMKRLYRGEKAVDRVLVVDCDVHQGDGTATFHAKSEYLYDKLFTLDLHAASNYPHPKQLCTYDVPLPDNCNDREYMSALSSSLDKAIKEIQPQLVLYNAGVDPYKHDKLGRLSLSWEGLQQRDAFVVRKCVNDNIPVACVVGGGYESDVKALGKRHALIHRVCSDIWREKTLWQRN